MVAIRSAGVEIVIAGYQLRFRKVCLYQWYKRVQTVSRRCAREKLIIIECAYGVTESDMAGDPGFLDSLGIMPTTNDWNREWITLFPVTIYLV